ncbi:Low-affinity glucose transporter HXT1 [Wickerhamomyces ciferrii]|uniref:Low-affinity glucose transporter HXT1 n=1 Tax=Wickerhamomyces ciferrii (strain ATCC 14091 / BCRC 22168 / CBS 111 / JCM 3599 / NBRC 0793 / NRRL Y-1031 F-60-10) TaxID=1206466 RepID=K0KSY3_WICCF|nr:Low-affinity glucose transporter HXT1 [Wickerhamomyces ciferrii]CCH44489.1 Low-affinity glucose transporter HXT1 [Wickerhamomyces ciferrii]
MEKNIEIQDHSSNEQTFVQQDGIIDKYHKKYIPRYNDFLKGQPLLWSITLCCLQAFLLLGYDQGVMANVIGNHSFNSYFNNPDANLQGDISATYDLGCVLGSIIAYFVGEPLGRRKMILIGATIMIIGTIFLGAATNVGIFITGRVITGVGNGMNSSTVPMLQSECSPALNRGMLLTLQGTVTILGLVIAYWTGYGTSFNTSSFQWRFPVSFQAFFAICLVLQAIWLPESPRWLIAHNRSKEGQQLIADLTNQDFDSNDVELKVLDIQMAIEEENKDGPFKFKEFFGMGKIQNFRRICLTIFLMIVQQFSFSNGLNYYNPIIYKNTMGFTENISNILGGCTAITYLLGSFIPVFVMDRFGRRTLLLFSVAGLSFCFIMVSILLSLEGNRNAACGAVAFIFLFQIFYSIGLLPVPWFYGSEINITRLRSRACAIASGWNWLAVYAIVKITPIAMENLGWKCFIIFAILNAFFIPIIYLFFPETANLELEDIDLIFYKGGITGGVWSTKGKTIEKNAHFKKDVEGFNEKPNDAFIEDVSLQK